MQWRIWQLLLYTLVGAALAATTVGCGARSPFAPPKPDFLDPKSQIAQQWVDAYEDADPDETADPRLVAIPGTQPTSKKLTKRQVRDVFADRELAAIDGNYSAFFQYHYERRAYGDFVFDFLNLGAGFYGTVASAKLDKTIASALVTIFTGTKLADESNLYNTKASIAIIAKMDELRAARRLQIEQNLRRTSVDYPMRMAMDEVGQYYRAGTAIESLAAIDQEANAGKQVAEKDLNNFRLTGKFQKDDASSRLLNFWKPGGKTEAENEAKLKAEMKKNGVDPDKVSPTFFIFSDQFAAERAKVVKDLGLQ